MSGYTRRNAYELQKRNHTQHLSPNAHTQHPNAYFHPSPPFSAFVIFVFRNAFYDFIRIQVCEIVEKIQIIIEEFEILFYLRGHMLKSRVCANSRCCETNVSGL